MDMSTGQVLQTVFKTESHTMDMALNPPSNTIPVTAISGHLPFEMSQTSSSTTFLSQTESTLIQQQQDMQYNQPPLEPCPSIPSTTVDLSSFQQQSLVSEVRQVPGGEDQISGLNQVPSASNYCSEPPPVTQAVVVDTSVVNGSPTPQAIQSINVMSQMTDNELLGFINPSTFEQCL